MLKSKLISIDPGKHTTKAMVINNGVTDNLSFRTKVFKLDYGTGIEAQGKSYNSRFEGKDYIIGDQGEEIDYTVDKATLNHKLAVYTAASQLLGDNQAVRMVLGCPTSIYKNKGLREEYRDYMMNDGRVRIGINGKNHLFIVENILVLPEGSGIVYTNPNLFKGKRVAVIDLGGLNMNFTVYDNLIPQPSSMFTLNHGYTEIETRLSNELSSMYGISPQADDIQNVLREGGLKVKGEMDIRSTQVIDGILDQYVLKLIQEVRKNNFNLDMMDVVFVGGTSLLVHDKLKEHIPHGIMMENAQWSNVEGFYRVGELKYGRK